MADATVTAANVAPVNTGSNRTIVAKVTAGATITAGQSVARRTDGKWDPADCDVDAELAGSLGAGISLNGAADGQPLFIAQGGELDPGFSATEGVLYVFSGNAGGVAPSADLATGDYVTIIGVGNSSGNIDIPRSGIFVSGSQVQ